MSTNVISVNFKKTMKLTGQERVSLRDIWEALEKPKQFGDWVRQVTKRLKKDNDYGVLHQTVKNLEGGRPTQDYWVTVDAAKLIAMLTNNTAGDAVRQYFLECEKLIYANGLEDRITSIPQLVSPEFLRKTADRMEALEKELAQERHLRLVTKQELDTVKADPIGLAQETGMRAWEIEKLPEAKAKLIPLALEATKGFDSKYGVRDRISWYLKHVACLKLMIHGNPKTTQPYALFNRDDVTKYIATLP